MGRKFTKEHKKKISLALSEKRKSKEHIEKIRLSKLGHKQSKETIEKRIKKNTGKKRNIETRRRLSKGKIGNKNPSWKGGISSINNRIRRSLNYRLWRKTVFERDKYTCVFCGKMGGRLEADHIKPFALFPELRFAIDNGRTLCGDCHRKTDNYGWKGKQIDI